MIFFLKSGSGNKEGTEGQHNSVEFLVLSSLTMFYLHCHKRVASEQGNVFAISQWN